MFVSKRKNKTWKESYFRKVINIDKNMRYGRKDPNTGAVTFNYEMAPIRQHKAIIKQIDVHGNLIIALDEEGIISLTFISYEDAEESKSYKIEEFAQRKVKCFQYDHPSQTLLVVEIDEELCIGLALYKLAIDDINEETVEVSETVYSGKTVFKISSNSVVKVFNRMIVICPDYRVDHPELGMNHIYIFDRSTGDLIRSIEHDDGMQDNMNIDTEENRNPVIIWDHFGIDTLKDSI